MENKVPILDIPFINIQFDEMLALLDERVRKGEKTLVVTANPEIVMITDENKEYKEIVQSADYVVPDGIGIIVASKMLNAPIMERIAGFDLMMSLLQQANTNRWKVYLLGGKDEVNQKAVKAIRETYPDLVIVGSHHGYFGSEESEGIKEEVQKLEPDLVFVALGAPRQEEWITQALPSFSKGLFMGVGGSFDILAGEAKRAPDIWIRLKLEWLYRLVKQPSRWRRMLAIPHFLMKILKQRLQK
ncbi:WecB/TagA/CpsF family glycosyltransferase [Robertmurraya massiliosenegalensis]|uniref:WecB/TagA/CpsF family glycosyltransferase n=1 Tax=Robertmurraya TaxID=2837507 RepID=UPI0039A781C7